MAVIQVFVGTRKIFALIDRKVHAEIYLQFIFCNTLVTLWNNNKVLNIKTRPRAAGRALYPIYVLLCMYYDLRH